MKKILAAALAINILGIAFVEYVDYKEAKRIMGCGGNTPGEFYQCLENRSLLYKLTPERPRIYLCLIPGADSPTKLCNLLGITQE